MTDSNQIWQQQYRANLDFCLDTSKCIRRMRQGNCCQHLLAFKDESSIVRSQVLDLAEPKQ